MHLACCMKCHILCLLEATPHSEMNDNIHIYIYKSSILYSYSEYTTAEGWALSRRGWGRKCGGTSLTQHQLQKITVKELKYQSTHISGSCTHEITPFRICSVSCMLKIFNNFMKKCAMLW